MKYYILDHSTEAKIVGTQCPQIQKMVKGYDEEASNSIYLLDKYYEELPPFTPNLDAFQLHARSKPTDLLTNVFSNGLVISKKLKQIFEQYKLCKHTFFEATLQHKVKVYNNYYWLHVVSDYTDYVDYSNSKFFIYSNFLHNLGYIKIDSKADYATKREKVKKDNPGKTIAIWSERIKFIPNFYEYHLDFFKVGTFSSNIFISDKLADTLLQNNITGIVIKDAPVNY